MNINCDRGPDDWVRRRLRGHGPDGRMVRDAWGNSIWVRTRATDPPERMIGAEMFGIDDTETRDGVLAPEVAPEALEMPHRALQDARTAE